MLSIDMITSPFSFCNNLEKDYNWDWCYFLWHALGRGQKSLENWCKTYNVTRACHGTHHQSQVSTQNCLLISVLKHVLNLACSPLSVTGTYVLPDQEPKCNCITRVPFFFFWLSVVIHPLSPGTVCIWKKSRVSAQWLSRLGSITIITTLYCTALSALLYSHHKMNKITQQKSSNVSNQWATNS